MKLIILAVIQSILLCGGQLMMKMALNSFEKASWSWSFIQSQLTNWWWPASGVTFTAAGLLWMYILKHWPFSQAYPLSSLAYVFGMIAAMLILHEHVAWTQWVGILFIMAGCYLVVN